MARILCALTAAASLGVLACAGSASAAPEGVKVGVLTCHVESGWGYIIGSSKDLHCEYRGAGGAVEHYVGDISKLGVDIGYTSSATIVWDVFAPVISVGPGALKGGYAGATASATVVAGVGANVLLGGFERSIALQPVSVMGSTGFDVAAGIGAMRLRPEGGEFAASYQHVDAEPPPPVREEIPPPHRHHFRHHHKVYCPTK